MPNPRAHLREQVQYKMPSGALAPLAGASVYVYQPGTTTVIVESMYSSFTGSTVLTNPVTSDTNGIIEFWVADEQNVDLSVTASGFTAQTIQSKAVGYDGGP